MTEQTIQRQRLFASAVHGVRHRQVTNLDNRARIAFLGEQDRKHRATYDEDSEESGMICSGGSEPYSRNGGASRRRVTMSSDDEKSGGNFRAVRHTYKTSPATDSKGNSISYSPVHRARVGSRKVLKVPSTLCDRISNRPSDQVARTPGRWVHDIFEDENPISAPASQVFIRGLSKSITEDFLRKMVRQAAGSDVIGIRVDRGPLTTAIIGFRRADSAAKVKQAHHGAKIDGAFIKVSVVEETNRPAKTRDSKEIKMDVDVQPMNMVTMVADSVPDNKSSRSVILTDRRVLS